jgi:hypothetical protein
MTFSSGSIITAADYNSFLGANNSSTINTVNTIWGFGNGSAGYGQTVLSNVTSGTSTITATQWASLINTLNSIKTHQTGSGTGLTATTAGQTITANAFITANLTTAYTNRLTFASNSAVVAGATSTTAWTSSTVNATLTRSFGSKATFTSANHARFFFNSGGRLKYNISATQNASTTARTNAAINLIGYLGGIALFGANTTGNITGVAGGTSGSFNTAIGYWTATYNSNVALAGKYNTTTAYTSDIGNIAVKTDGTQQVNNDNGAAVSFWTTISSTAGANAGGLSFDDGLGINFIQSIDVSYPELTNLSNTWGAVTISTL